MDVFEQSVENPLDAVILLRKEKKSGDKQQNIYANVPDNVCSGPLLFLSGRLSNDEFSRQHLGLKFRNRISAFYQL
jgi:hypothetical protein